MASYVAMAKLRVRSEPGKGGEVIYDLHKGDVIKVLEERDAYMRLDLTVAPHAEAWVTSRNKARSLVEATTDPPTVLGAVASNVNAAPAAPADPAASDSALPAAPPAAPSTVPEAPPPPSPPAAQPQPPPQEQAPAETKAPASAEENDPPPPPVPSAEEPVAAPVTTLPPPPPEPPSEYWKVLANMNVREAPNDDADQAAAVTKGSIVKVGPFCFYTTPGLLLFMVQDGAQSPLLCLSLFSGVNWGLGLLAGLGGERRLVSTLALWAR